MIRCRQEARQRMPILTAPPTSNLVFLINYKVRPSPYLPQTWSYNHALPHCRQRKERNRDAVNLPTSCIANSNPRSVMSKSCSGIIHYRKSAVPLLHPLVQTTFLHLTHPPSLIFPGRRLPQSKNRLAMKSVKKRKGKGLMQNIFSWRSEICSECESDNWGKQCQMPQTSLWPWFCLIRDRYATRYSSSETCDVLDFLISCCCMDTRLVDDVMTSSAPFDHFDIHERAHPVGWVITMSKLLEPLLKIHIRIRNEKSMSEREEWWYARGDTRFRQRTNGKPAMELRLCKTKLQWVESRVSISFKESRQPKNFNTTVA